MARARILACINGWKTTREKTTSEVLEVTIEEPLRYPSATVELAVGYLVLELQGEVRT